jgi:hypothetical protein
MLGDDPLGGPQEDDVLITLNRMRDLTARVLHLETRLRRQYHDDKRAVLDAPTVLTVGQGHVLKEIKLANDNLRWRLNQRQRSLLAAQEAMTQLRNHASEAELRARSSEEEVDRLKKMIIKYREKESKEKEQQMSTDAQDSTSSGSGKENDNENEGKEDMTH